MVRIILFFVSFFSSGILYSQQNNEFREVKEYYDYQRNMLSEAFRREALKTKNNDALNQMNLDYEEFMVKLDSIQNVAMLSALIKVKNREDLARIKKQNQEQIDPLSMQEIPAEYPGGIDTLRKQVAAIFYYDAVNTQIPKISTNINFVVEEDGSISTVRADGENFTFNRQAEIAVYMLPEKFNPAKQDGKNIRYGFRIPLTMRFE